MPETSVVNTQLLLKAAVYPLGNSVMQTSVLASWINPGDGGVVSRLKVIPPQFPSMKSHLSTALWLYDTEQLG